MEEFSILKTPAYPKVYPTLSRPHYSDRSGYTITYYEPIYDVDLKIPGLGIAEVPFIPIQHVRQSRGHRPFVPRHLTQEDMIQINLRAERKAKDIMKDFHPSQKATYESPRDFQMRKEIESKLDDIRETCASTNNYFRKAEKYDFTRKSLFNPRTKTRFEDKDKLKDIILDSHVEHLNEMKKGIAEDKDNHRSRFRMLSAGCKPSRQELIEQAMNTKIEVEENEEEPEPSQFARKTSREQRADDLKILQERIKKQETESDCFERTFGRHLSKLRGEVNTLSNHTDDYLADTRYKTFKIDQTFRRFKQTSIEIEQLNARVIEAETKLKSEVQRIKKKMQIQITELEMSLDVANKTNIDLQKVIKKQSLQLTEITASYEELQRQLQTTIDQYSIAQRRIQSLSGELEELRVNYDSALRAKRQVEISLEESGTRNSELQAINLNLQNTRGKLEAELATLASDYEEVTRELRISDERYQKIQVELKSTIQILHDEQERIVKIEAIKKSLEVEVKNLSVRLEEVEANAVVGARRAISKLEAQVRDLELELESEKKNHAETIKILRKKERTVKEIVIQCEEDQKNVLLLQEQLDKANARLAQYKRQLSEQEGLSAQSITRVRRVQRELEAAEERADVAESSLNLVRTKHRTFVTTSTVPGSQLYLVSETVRQSSIERS
ncbi:hypothetical protein PVAND_008405 [Polypedilum vanderplanki]|uniref:Myosin tail domain-containing protein n=1 Tax=Polypedilum vanderplanki TaxID=319348 RepID=A0A9J6C9I3_POLVA|nr:hypothetical protein PVAND_008405 [Polypedilum vanderplanki]